MKRFDRKIPQSTRSQQGISSLALLVILILVSFTGLCAFRIVPLYYENFMLGQSLKSVDNPTGSINAMTNAEIRDAITKNFRINQIDLDPREIVISRDNNITTLSYSYEARTDLIYNIGVVASFDLQYP